MMTALLNVNDAHVHYGRADRPVRAVDGVSLQVERGESVGLVGESGCGKSTLGRAIIRLEDVKAGSIFFDGADITAFRGRALKAFRQQAQMIFQDPFESLNPRMAVGKALEEVLLVHKKARSGERRNRAAELFDDVGLDQSYLDRYPHEFSGGQRQRIGIARALAVSPKLLIADEPVSALDVSVQVQILNLLRALQEKWNLSYLFVAHDLAVVRYMCNRIYVMYLGRIVEMAPAEALYSHPAHPYTKALLSAVPDVERGLRSGARKKQRIVLKGDVPSAAQVIPGCPFHPRCPRAKEKCSRDVPELRRVADGHLSACHYGREPAGFYAHVKAQGQDPQRSSAQP